MAWDRSAAAWPPSPTVPSTIQVPGGTGVSQRTTSSRSTGTWAASGALEGFEIWSRDRWAEHRQALRVGFDDMTRKLSEQG